jgi:fumarylacetoacetate (FAA) hydrolase
MKLVTFLNKEKESRIGWLVADAIVDMQLASPALPTDMLTFIDHHEQYFEIIKALGEVEPHYSLSEVKLLAPLPNPRSFRDYIGFEMHMQNASRSFGHKIGLLGMICLFFILPITKQSMDQRTIYSVLRKKRNWILS